MRGDDHEQALFASIELSPIAGIVTDPRQPDNPIVAVNAAFERLTGYPRAELLGRNCRLLAGAATEKEATAALRDAIAERRPALVELLNYRRDGSPFRNAVMVAPVFDAGGALVYFIGSQMEAAPQAAAVRAEQARERLGCLTERQRQVLSRMATGLRNKQIAAELGLTEKTVKMHRAALLDRIGAATSADAVRVAVEAEL
jgi:hypothetical protein